MQKIKISQGLSNNIEARKIREAVFVHEQGFKEEFDEIDENAYHLVVYNDDVAVATGRMYPKVGEPQTYIFGRIAVLKPYRNLHLGKVVMDNLEEKAKELNAKFIQLSAQMQAKGFYEKLSYRSVGEVYLDEGCPHILMVKSVK